MGMRKIESLAIVLSMSLLGSILLMSTSGWLTISRPMELIEATIEGGAPWTVDPAFAYDTASGELVQNVYDTLITFNGERTDQYLPSAATSWTIQSISETSPEGFLWNARYTFAIRAGMTFSNGDPVTPETIVYSFEREMVYDTPGGPQWMLYEPLLNNGGGAAALGDIGTPGSPGPDVALVGNMIDDAVEYNGTHVWFNLMFPGTYAPFMQILCQTWSSIMDRAYITTIAGEWSVNWMLNGDHTDWINYHGLTTSPLDSAGNVMMGSGPFVLENLDYTGQVWSVNRNANYWRGWPINWPTAAGAQPRGYVNHVICDFGKNWDSRRAMFLAGDIDFCAVPRSNISEVLGQPGIRCFSPLPMLNVDALLFTFDISTDSPYGPINTPGVFTENAIPSDFFGNPTWGIYVRRAFAYAFDYGTYLATVYVGEAYQPATAIILGLPYYDPTVVGYSFSLANAQAEFRQVPGLWNTGFTITLLYNSGNIARQTICNLLQAAIQSLNPNFMVNVVQAPWGTVLNNALSNRVPALPVGWLADYPDPNNFAFPFYDSQGYFSRYTGYRNDQMDVLISQGIRTPDGQARDAIYRDIQQLVVEDCPSFTLDQSFGRHFERDWVVGWYYNMVYQGDYVANLWKWYYVEEALQSTPAQPYSNRIPCDFNYDGYINMMDVGTVCRCFGAQYGPPIDPRWIFRADINNDRKIDMRDIGLVAKQFGKSSPVWVIS